MQKLIFCISIICFQFVSAQTEKLIHGKVLNDDFPVQGVKVINLATEKSVVTNNNGDFSILAKPNDILVFYALEYNYLRKTIAEKDIYDENLTIKIIKKPVELKEVVIEKSKIDAVSAGVLQKPAKEYTPAERKLRAASKLNPTGSISGFLGGALQIDPVINAITGRTKKLKNELSVERKEKLLSKVENLYDNDFYTNKLKIPADYIKAFQYYIIYDDKFIEAMKAKNKTLTTFRVIELAKEFNDLLTSENKN